MLRSTGGEQIVERSDAFLAGLGWVDFDDTQVDLIACRPPEDIACRVHDLAVADVGESLLPCTLFRANTIARDGKHSIFKTSGNHGIRAVREHQVGGMGDNIRTFERQGAGGFGIEPVEADHEPDPRWTNIIDGKSRVPRRKP